MARKEKKFHYIYKITNTKNGKYYIGMHSTDNIDDGYFGSGKRLRNSIRKHGKDSHDKEILEYLDDGISLIEREVELVNEDLLKDPMCMNLLLGGTGGITEGVNEWSNEMQRELSKRGNARLKFLRENDKEWVKKLSEKRSIIGKIRSENGGNINFINSFKNKNHTQKTKDEIGAKSSISQTGEKNSQFGTIWVNNCLTEKKINSSTAIEEGWKRGRIKKK
jgi:hypothetical protein